MSTPCKTLNLWGNIMGHQYNPTNSRGFVPTKSWWTEGEASHILTMIRAPTPDMGYVPNVKYLAHIPHQTKFIPIYQMC